MDSTKKIVFDTLLKKHREYTIFRYLWPTYIHVLQGPC